MSTTQQYWLTIARLLEERYGQGHPRDWNRSMIQVFLTDLSAELRRACRHAPAIAERCGIVLNTAGEPIFVSTIGYHSFRRLFKTYESQGQATTRHMFAVYLGYESYETFVLAHNPRDNEEEQPRARTLPWLRAILPERSHMLPFTLFLGIALAGYFFFASMSLSPDYLLFRTDNGISVLRNQEDQPVQLIRDRFNITGLDIDPYTHRVFWSNYEGYHTGVATFILDLKTLTKVPRSTQLWLIDSTLAAGPCGIAVDPRTRSFYLANHLGRNILHISYTGTLLDTIVGQEAGRPSSIELDTQRQVLYWTDVERHRIGRYLVKEQRSEPDFMVRVGKYPDGLSIDYSNRRLFWAAGLSNQLGWTDLTVPAPQLFDLPLKPAAVEYDPTRRQLLISTQNSNLIYTGQFKSGRLTVDTLAPIDAGHLRPGIMRIVAPE